MLGYCNNSATVDCAPVMTFIAVAISYLLYNGE